MAPSAGVVGSEGVAGITIASGGPGRAAVDVNITSPFIENIHSLDPTYLSDQDGIRIFTEEDNGSVTPFETHFSIRGGKIRNCGGRSIKSQAEFGSVDGVMMARRGTNAYINRQGNTPDVDFQTGGGILTNCEFQYSGSTPERVVGWTGTPQIGGKYSTGITVSNIKVTYSGAQHIGRFFRGNLNQQKQALIVLENIEVVNIGSYIDDYFATVEGPVACECFIRLSNILVPLNTNIPVLHRLLEAMTVYASFSNIANSKGATAKFSSQAVAGAWTEDISGNNVRVAS
jgi:hypothetical protein